MQYAYLFAKTACWQKHVFFSFAIIAICYAAPVLSFANPEQEVEISGELSPEPVEKTTLEQPELPSNTNLQQENTLLEGTTDNNDKIQSVDTDISNVSMEDKLDQEAEGEGVGKNETEEQTEKSTELKEQVLAHVTLGKHQLITVAHFTFTGIDTDLLSIDEEQLREHFSMSMQNAFTKNGFTTKIQASVAINKQVQEPSTSVFVTEDAAKEQNMETLNPDNATISGEVYSIHVSPINTITVAGLKRMNAKVEISGRALVMQETNSTRLITNKSFAGISNINKKASDNPEMHADLYKTAVKQALDECASNLVRTLTISHDTP